VLVGLTPLLGVQPGHVRDPIACLSGDHCLCSNRCHHPFRLNAVKAFLTHDASGKGISAQMVSDEFGMSVRAHHSTLAWQTYTTLTWQMVSESA
jgi:hypothetical protein